MSVPDVFNATVSHALASGWFERVNQHEPKSAPSTGGLTASVWVERIVPARMQSGLNSTTSRIDMHLRIYSSMLQEPQDSIDPNLLAATDVMMAAYSGDFELGGIIRNVVLLDDATGPGMAATFGYLNQDSKVFRVSDITVPMIINDLWSQSG